MRHASRESPNRGCLFRLQRLALRVFQLFDLFLLRGLFQLDD